MSYGSIKTIYGRIASGASTCTSIDLGQKGWARVMLEVGTMSTAVNMDIYGSADNSIFRQLFERTNTATAGQWQSMIVSQTLGANGGICPITAPVQYLQIRGTAVVSGGVSLTVICSD